MFSSHNRSNNRHAYGAGDVADDLMQQHIHFGECLLDALHMDRGTANQVIPLSNIASEDADLVLGTKRSREQSVTVSLNP